MTLDVVPVDLGARSYEVRIGPGLIDDAGAQILPFLRRVKEETNLPMLYVSHARAEVEYLADRTLGMEAGRLLAFGRWQLDTSARHLLDKDGTMVALSGAEYRLLRVFLDHPQRVLSRDQLLNLTQGRDADLFDRSIDLLVSRLRQRLLDDAREPAYIKTVRSEGYVFSLPVEILGAPA